LRIEALEIQIKENQKAKEFNDRLAERLAMQRPGERARSMAAIGILQRLTSVDDLARMMNSQRFLEGVGGIDTIKRFQPALWAQYAQRFPQAPAVYGEAAIAALRTAYATNKLDLYLKQSAGGTVLESLTNASTLNGLLITKAPALPKGEGPELATLYHYEITAEAECKRLCPAGHLIASSAAANLYDGSYTVTYRTVVTSGAAAQLASYEQTATLVGGGVDFVHIPALDGGPPVRQETVQRPWTVNESGRLSAWRPGMNPPADPYPARNRKPGAQLTQSVSRKGDGSPEYQVAWSRTYEFDRNPGLHLSPLPSSAPLDVNAWIVYKV